MRSQLRPALAGSILTLLACGGAAAADPVFPRGAAVGLEPPAGLVVADRFAGFQSEATGASILVVELPAAAFSEIQGAMSDSALKTRGMKVSARRTLKLKDGPALLIRGSQTVGGREYRKWVLLLGARSTAAMVTVQVPVVAGGRLTDAAIETALGTVVVRAAPEMQEKLDALPFRIGDLGGLRLVHVLAGGAALLTEGPEDQFTDASQPVMIVAASSGEAPAEADRAAFARRAFETLAGVEKAQITTEATPAPGSIRIEGRGVDSDSGRPVQVVQVLRFEGKGYLRTVGIARTEVAGFGARVARLAGSLQAR